MLRAVIFDLDGLLVDTEILSYEMYRTILGQYGKDIHLSEYVSQYSGRTGRENLIRLIGSYQLPITYDEGSRLETDIEHDLLSTKGAPLKPGALQLLQFLADQHIKIALGSSSLRQRAISILQKDGVLQYFDLLVTSDDFSNGKPDPEVYQTAVHKLGLHTDECLVLEDSEAGIEAAYRAGIPVVNIPDMKAARQEYLDLCAAVFSSLDQVIPYIQDLQKTEGQI